MITCQHARHLFDSYLDGELSASLQTELHAHRLNCTACQNELALLEACGDVIAMDRREPQIGASFTDRVLMLQRGRQLPRRRRWSRTAWLVGSPMAAAACLAMMFSIVTPPNHRPVGTVVDAKIEAIPAGAQDTLQQSGRPQTPAARDELARTPQMQDTTFNATVRASFERFRNKSEDIRRGTEELGQLVNSFSSEKLAAVWQSVQKEKAAADAADRVVSDVDPFDPSYLSPPPVAPDSNTESEANNPVEAL